MSTDGTDGKGGSAVPSDELETQSLEADGENEKKRAGLVKTTPGWSSSSQWQFLAP